MLLNWNNSIADPIGPPLKFCFFIYSFHLMSFFFQFKKTKLEKVDWRPWQTQSNRQSEAFALKRFSPWQSALVIFVFLRTKTARIDGVAAVEVDWVENVAASKQQVSGKSCPTRQNNERIHQRRKKKRVMADLWATDSKHVFGIKAAFWKQKWDPRSHSGLWCGFLLGVKRQRTSSHL